jgi:hypothetical protein
MMEQDRKENKKAVGATDPVARHAKRISIK